MSDYDDRGDPRRYRREEWRTGSNEDAWAAGSAEDHYDEGSAEDLSQEHYAAGLSYDPYYDQQYQPGYVPPPSHAAYPPPAAPSQLPYDELPDSAQRLRNRFVRKTPVMQNQTRPRDGIDGLFDMRLGDVMGTASGFLPCSPVLILLLVLILVFGCIGMAALAANSLSDILSGF